MSIKKRGNKYYVDFTLDGKRIREVSPDNSLAGAKAFEAYKRNMAKNESANNTGRKRKNYTFEVFSREWLLTYAKPNNKPSEYTNKVHILKNHLLPFFGDMPLEKIGNHDIEVFKAEKRKTELATKTINNILIVLNKALRSALDWEIINTVPKVKLLKVAPQKFDFLSRQELKNLLDNTKGEIRDMILIVAKTGMRLGEFTALDWSDINLENNCLTVSRAVCRGKIGSTKGYSIRHIPLTDDVVEMLQDRPIKSGLLFPSNNQTPIAPYLLLKRLKSACKEAGLRKIGFHVLRHTYVSHLAQTGIPMLSIKEIMRHSDINTTMRYAHLGHLDARSAIDKLEASHNSVTN
jgi:integrase